MAAPQDPRKTFVVDTIAGAIAPVPDQKAAYAEYLGRDDSGAIAAFLDDASTNLLQVSVAKSANGQLQVRLTNAADFPQACFYQLSLSKVKPGVLALADVPGGIALSTIANSPLSSLYHSLSNVYCPVLGIEQQGSTGHARKQQQHQAVDPRLQELILHVQAGLGKALRGADAAQAGDQAAAASLHEILNPLDELQYWADMAGNAAMGVHAQAAAQVVRQLEPLQQQLSGLAAGSLEGDWEGALELVGHLGDALRQVWPLKVPPAGWAFPQRRMQHFIQVLGAAFAGYVQRKLQGVDLWRTSFNVLKGSLIVAGQLLNAWASEACTLSSDWAVGVDAGDHMWEGPACADSYLAAFQERLEQIYALRELHEELTALLSQEEAAALGLGSSFAPFAQLAALHVSEFTGAAWATAAAEHERRLEAVEARISQKLKELFATVIIPNMTLSISQQAGQRGSTSTAAAAAAASSASVAHPQQLFQELRQYSRLLSRRGLAAALEAELLTLAKQVDAYLEHLQQEFDQLETGHSSQSAASPGRLMHGMADKMSRLMQCQAKTSSVQDILQLLTYKSSIKSDSAAPAATGDAASPAAAALRGCLGTATSLLLALAAHKKEAFQAWQDDVRSQLADMASWKSSRLMSFDAASSHVRCQFSEGLVGLLREVRQLQALGFNMRRELLAEVETAGKFYRYGMVLQQCAHFYNNIATEMIPCQKPLMLADAVEFEKVLMSPKDATGRDITWQSASALEGYVRRLSAVAERLAASNRQLRQWHSVLAGKVVTLMSTDLVRHKDTWVSVVKDMRAIFSNLEAQGCPRERQEVWRHHWDFQLYKALEVQFRAGLENINKTLPEVEVSLVYKNRRLQYDPPLEELRLQHFSRHLNGFLGLPLRMKGVSSLSERQGFFAPIADADPAAIARVYESCEALFAGLADEAKKYSDWLVLGDVAGELEEHVEAALCGDGSSSSGAAGGDVGDWELNLRMLKTAAHDLNKLPNEVHLDCYRVSLSPFKAYVEEMIKRLREALGASLRKKALAERQAIEDFLSAGDALLALQASSVEEIGRAGQEARCLVARLAEVPQLRKRMEEKNRLLRQMAAATPAGATASSSLTPVDLSGLSERWDGFVGQLQAYDSHLEGQRQGLQVQLGKKVEDFAGAVAGFASRWQSIKPRGGPSGNPAVVMAQLEDAARQLQDVQEEAEQLCKECEALGVAPPAFPQLDEVSADLAATQASWGSYRDFLQERDSMAHKDWLSMRDQVWKIEDFLTKCEGSCSGASTNDPGKVAIALVLLQEIDTYRRCLPHLKSCMRGVGWEDSHWLQLFTLLGFKSGSLTKESVTLAQFLDKADAIIANVEKIKALDAMAQGEALIRKALSELKLWGLQRTFSFVPSKDSSTSAAAAAASAGKSSTAAAGGLRPVQLINEWSEVLSELGNHQSLVASLKTSHYHHLFKDEVASWEGRLSTLVEGLGLLQGIQRRWLYLEPIFGRGALPAVAGRFRHVDGEFRAIMAQLAAAGKVVAFAELPGVLARLSAMAAQLDACQRALAEFLEEKRAAFPRFYFLGDDDLLEVLGQASSLGVIQAHLKKLFAGIHRVRFSGDQGSITAMMSAEGEVVDLAAPVKVTDTIEAWLEQLTGGMRSTLQLRLSGIAGMDDPFGQAPAQVLGLYHALRFTARVEAAIRTGKLQQLSSELRQELAALSSRDCSGNTLLQLKKQGLIIDLMHACDVVEGLLGSGSGSGHGIGGGANAGGSEGGVPRSPEDWTWAKQLRYYAAQDGSVSVCMAEAELPYTWEYAGNAPKLVVTPLTDRCFLTLTQALALGYGGNPYGPAGTGKTESVKALGQALGRQVLVFNCDEEFDVRAMGRIFVGLLRCGAWGCFDEFNRLGEDVLSAVSQQVQAIQTALKEGAAQLSFIGKQVEVNPAAGLFVTLNPAGKGYGGRSKLPDNLKQMFRPIAMSVPDNDLIAEVLLASEGFAAARTLAGKLVALFSLCREGLSRQQHYDWGLRALKTCLGAAGRLLRQHRKAQQAPAAQDSAAETELVLKAVRATKLPTLTFEDVGRFRGLLGDIFPGTAVTDTTNSELQTVLQRAAADIGLQLTPQQVERMLQLHLAFEQRIGVIIVGPSGSGKSTLWQVLERGLELLGSRPVVYRLNPKAMPRQQLLGALNLDTREWSDGVLTAAARKVVQEPLEQRSWIVCDGDVDPEWIESLNSVLDDNRLLTMPNGERIQFGSNVNLIFECDSLAYASPATVSRCGMLFMSDAAVDPASVMAKWLSQHPAADPTGKAAAWFNQLFSRAHDLALSQPVVVPSTKFGLLENVLSHLASGVSAKRDLAVGLARGLAYTLSPEHRKEFVAQLVRLAGSEVGSNDLLAVPASDDPLACLLQQQDPSDMALHSPQALDYLDHWLMVTDDVRVLLAVLAPWLADQQPFLLVGPEGCGKSTLLDYCFSRLPGSVTVATVHCSAQTSADTVIQKLLQVCGKPVTNNQGKCLRPDTGRVILYLKDINLPKPDKYQTMQVVAFTQQLLTHGGYYDEHLEFIRVERIQVVASMVPGSSAGHSVLSRRFTARLRLAVVGYPEPQQLEAVYTRMMQQAFGSSTQKQAAVLASQAGSYARCMVQLYQQLQASLGSSYGSSGSKVHCSFNPRHLTAWVQGLQRYDLSHVDVVEAVAAEGLATFGGCLPDAAARQLEQLLLAALRNGLGYRGGLPTVQVFSSLTASPEARMAAAAAGTAMPLSRLSSDDAAGLMAGVMRSFTREMADTPLLLVPQALQRVAALDRCLSVPSGAVLLVGPAGSGRRSLAQLMAHAHGMRWWSPRISRRFDAAACRAELKEVLRAAGVEGTPLLLFLEERHLADDPGVLELLNCLLSAGEVPGLFGPDELAKDMAALEAKRTADTHYQGPPSSYAYFLACLQRHLRIAISLDPASEGFALQLEQNPALLNRCSMLAWQGWSDASLQAIAQGRLQEVLASLDCSEQDRTELLSLLLKLHNSAAAQLAAAPRHFMAAADLYRATISSKREQLLQQQQFLKGGLDRLAEAAGTVDELSQQAEAQRTLLAAKQGEADAALGDIQSSMEVAADRRREVEQLRQQLGETEAALQQRRGQVEAQLADVQPLIDAARTAVGGIKADNINEVRSLRMAPDVIRDVLEGVLLLMGQEDTSWAAMKAFLGKRSVKEDIINYDTHRILATPGLRSKLDKLMAIKGASFEKKVAYRASQAAGPMAVWVTANLAYSDVLKQTAPLEKELASLKGGLADSQARLQQCQEELQQLDDQVVRLKAEFQARIREAEALKLQLARAEGTVNAASDLLSKLSGERSRWAQQLAALDGQLAELPRAALAAAAFITYLPAHPEDVRGKVMQGWTSLLGLPSFSLASFMSSEAQQLTWQGQGLPSDDLSAQNALAILHGVMTPLVIDPSSQAIEWLKVHIKAAGQTPEVLPMHDPHFQNSLELAVRFGKVLVVSEVDRVLPILHPLLRGDIEKQAGRLVVPVGDKLVDANASFKLYLVTRNASPQLTPDVLPLLTVTNFSITRSGLESQLLSLTLQHEQPELESRKTALLASEAGLKVQLAGLEKQLLQALATSTGNLLEDTALLTSLNDTKSQASSVAAALQDGQALAAQLDEQRSAYRPLAARGSLLYFTLVQLRQLDPMYCFSLNAFLKLFKQLLRWAAQAAGPASKANSSSSNHADALARNALLCNKLLELVHASVSRAVFNRDQLTLAVHLARSLLPDQFPAEEWAAFLSCSSSGSGSVSNNVTNSSATPGTRPGSATAAGAGGGTVAVPSWIRGDRAAVFEQLAATLPNLVAAAQLHDARIWVPWASSTAGIAANSSSSSSSVEFVPAAAAGRLTGLQQLILVAAFKPECLSAAAGKLVCQLLHLPALTPAPLSMRQMMEAQDGNSNSSSSSREPVLFITTPGADPSQELAAYAEAQVGRERLHELAMGQGQSEVALQLLRECAKTGDWLLLKNLHLVVAWLPLLEKEVHSLPHDTLHPSFRLFLTTEAHPRFPATLLEGALKVVFEAPPGVKMNLQRTYSSWSSDFLAGHNSSTTAAAAAAGNSSSTQQQQLAVPAELVPLRAQLLFLLAWFNAVVQERRNYVPFGWSTAYDFSVADLRAASDVVGRAAACSGPAGPDWQQLLGLLQVIYSGRVDRKQDSKVLLAHLGSIFQPELLTALPAAASAAAYGHSASGRRLQQQQQRRLPGLAASVGPLPASGSKQDWQAFVAALPDADAPEVFGLPANIERAMAMANSRQLLAALQQMGAAQGTAGGFDWSAWSALLQPLVKLWDQLLALAPPALRQTLSSSNVASAAAANSSSSSQLGPVDSFVALERAYGVTLLQLVARTMAGVKGVLAGEAPTAAVQAAASSLLQGQVCAEWDTHWEGPSSPADYLRAAMRRAAALEALSNLGQQPGGLLAHAGAAADSPLDLGQLFRPGAFLSALGQQAARNAGVSLGVLRLASCWQGGRLPARCPLAVHVGGMLLQGALFDGHSLSPAWQDSPLISAAPVFTLAWLPPDAPPPHPQAIPVPLFFNSEGRAGVVAELQLPVASAAEQRQWTLAGVSLMLSD